MNDRSCGRLDASRLTIGVTHLRILPIYSSRIYVRFDGELYTDIAKEHYDQFAIAD